MARLGAARSVPMAETKRVVSALVGAGPRGEACVQSVLVGKVGLALSGGGFRASLYHLGVLARLAESDVLRHVEALSTVSGGSMVGAAYYLRLRRLLSTDGDPDRSAYVRLVKDLIEDFREGTNANLRSSLLTDLRVCHAILSGDDEAYAAGLADAIFRTLYSRTVASDPHMAELSIRPADAEPDFHPRYHNLQRRAKVPALLLNATALNTGHSWQFTATSMGESPFSIVAGADPLPRLRRAYYVNQQGKTVRGVTLSQAVAASACVPGLFAPLTLAGLYEGFDVRLVDGGVYDNQGALALLQEDCSALIVSDAGGQLGLDKEPGGGHVSPLLRSVGIFQERMRQASYENLRAGKESGRLGGLAYVHLKQGLEAPPVNWKDCEDPSREDDQLPATTRENPTTGYGVWKRQQARLADIRTDLDAFSDIESAALMASGYMAMDTEMKRLIRDVPALGAHREEADWFFSPLIPRLGAEQPALARHLEAGSVQFLRLMKLDRKVRNVVLGLIALALLIVAAVLWGTWEHSFNVSVGWIVLTLAGVAAPFVVRYALADWSWALILTDPLGALRSRAGRWLGALATWMLARWLVPRLTARYLENEKLARLHEAAADELNPQALAE
jgi:predicted acylesterase/phospholipase RssA